MTDAVCRSDRRKDRLYKILREKGAVRRYVLRRLFPLLERMGIHATADHFYEIIPNIREVARDWSDAPRACTGIDFRAEQAEAWLLRLLGEHGGSFAQAAALQGYYEDNSYFRGVDALALFCLLRDWRPRRVIEVGHGFSTRVILAALEENAKETGVRPSLLSLDPYARFVPERAEGVDFVVVSRGLQDGVNLVTGTLEAGDLLFVDSTHVHKHGSDVEVYFDSIYPGLAPGVHVHVHDVFSPYRYPLYWMTRHRRFWNEQYVLEAFLAFNRDFAVDLPLHLLMRQSAAVQAATRGLISGPDHLFAGQSLYFTRVN